jgi:ribose transport system permease protein
MHMSQMDQIKAAPAKKWTALGRFNFRDYGIIVVLALLMLVGSILSPQFLKIGNLSNILRQASIQGFVALGMTFVIISGGIDLSIGSVVALASVLVAGFSRELPAVVGIFIALGAGLVVGSLNALLITRLRFQPFIATLATMAIARGYAMQYSHSLPIFGTLPVDFFKLAAGNIFGFPLPAFLFACLVVIGGFFLRRTSTGRSIYQIGGREESARLSGVPVERVKFFVYALSGVSAAFSGLVLASRMQSGDSVRTGMGWELDVIAAVVIGGTSLSGGVGSIYGTVGGVLITTILANIFNLTGVNPYWQRVIIGAIICVAVWSYQTQKSGVRRAKKGSVRGGEPSPAPRARG